MLFSKYMGYTIVKKSEDGKDKFIAERVSRYDIFDQQKKYQPFARGRFDGDFRNKITNLEYIQRQFVEWLQEMTQQSRKFSPFNLKTDDVFNFVKGNVSLFIKKHATYKNWAKVDNELNRQITKIDKSLENEKKFIELFYRATEELINQTSTNKGSEGDKYIFRLQNEGDFGLLNTIEHWDVSDIYGEKQRNAIKSSNKESENQPTSIPSPFARIALVKTAFAEVVAYGDGALRAYQKIVSDTLDVAEIFFTFDKWKDKIEIIKWDKVEDLKQLSEHKHFHKTLTVFLKNDAESYNFDEMKCLYILKFKATGEMIGATSPCTLFFSTANKLVDENGDFFIGTGKDKKTFGTIELSNNHRAFAEIYPLHKRSWDFQKYLYTWIKAKNKNWDNGNTPVSIYNEFVKYLNSEKELSGRIEEIDNLIDNFEDYDIFPAETPVEVCGNRLHKLRGFINVESLTVSDLMEDKIISLPYAIDSASFFDGNLINGKCYLLPLKEKFFELPESRDLKKQIRIEGGESTVNVILELSNNGSLKKFEKVYKRSEMTLVELSDYDCSIFPNVKFQEEKNAFYRVGLYLPYSAKEIESNIDFYQGTNKIILGEVDSIIRNINDSENVICKIYSLNQRTFDRMRVKIGDATGVLIPTLPEKQPNVVFTFAVDFGTTNTHIEYKTNIDNTIRPFDIKENEKQIQFLHGKIDENILVSDIDFIPKTIGQDKGFKFPVRTALSLSRNRERSQTILPFVQSNMIIPYEKRVVPKYNEVFTQLKWDSTEDEMGYYIDSLCFMLRNKVVLNDGNLSETKIVWFYPLSMAGSRSTVIRNKWKLAYLKYFLGISATSIHDLEINQNEILERNLIELPESIAPFLYYKYDRSYKDVINNLVSIDIGGGTTDIVFVEDGNTKYVTSFRFAADSVFGLGEQITSVVSKYQSDIENIILDENRSGGAKYNYLFDNIYRGIIGDTEKGDIASFFFALKNHERLQNIENDRIDFNAMLTRDSDQKLIFVLFYSAIIYHTAQIMKAKKMELPRHIAFSGNGSRIINIIGDKKVLAELSKCIFEKVYEKKYGNSGLDIIQNTKNPKELTCKGGIKAADKNYDQGHFEPLVLWGIDNDTFITDNDTYSSVDIKYSVTETSKKVKEFTEYVVNELVYEKYTEDVVLETFAKVLNINQQALKIAKDILKREDDLVNFTRNGIKNKIDSIGNVSNIKIEETFFFYPITSLLNVISKESSEIENSSNSNNRFFRTKNGNILNEELNNSTDASFRVFNIRNNEADFEYCGGLVNPDYFDGVCIFENNPANIPEKTRINTVKHGIVKKDNNNNWVVDEPAIIKFI